MFTRDSFKVFSSTQKASQAAPYEYPPSSFKFCPISQVYVFFYYFFSVVAGGGGLGTIDEGKGVEKLPLENYTEIM